MALDPYTSGFSQGIDLLESATNGSGPVATPTSRKRQLEELENTENQLNSSRPRLSTAHEKEVIGEAPGYRIREEHSSLPQNVQDNTTIDSTDLTNSLSKERPQDQSTIEKTSQHHDLEKNTSAHHGADGINSVTAPREIPRSWDEALEADQALFEMWNAGQDWLEIGKMWKQLTGEDATEVELASRYNRLTSETQTSMQDDDASLFAAVEEVMAKFKRDKWQLVSEAMARRGTIGLSDSQCRQRFKELVRGSPKSPATKQSQKIEQDQTGLIIPARLVSNTILQAAQESDGSGICQAANISNGKPDFLLNNAVVLEDSDAEPRASSSMTVQKTNGNTNVPHADPRFSFDGPVSKEDLGTDTTQTSTAKTTASRVGSATNRGPARFTPFRKHKDEDALRKPRRTRDAPINLVKVPRIDPVAMNSLQVNRVFSPYHPHEVTGILSSPNEQRPSDAQSQEQAQQGTSRQQSHLSQSPTAPTCVGPQQSPSWLPPTSEAPSKADSPSKSLPINEVQYSQPPQDHGFTYQRSLSQSFDKHVMDEASILPPMVNDLVANVQDPGKLTISVSKQQLDCMIGNKRLDGPKGSKTWEMISRECGVNATLAEISSAFEEAGYPSILRTPTVSPLSVHPASHRESAEARSNASPYTSVPPMETSAVTKRLSNAENLQPPSRILETPAPVAITQSIETPMTETKRGRGRPRKESSDMSKSPSQVRKLGSRTPNAKISAAMTASWARRKAKIGHGDVRPKSKAIAPTRANPKDPSSAAQYAAQILAAADAKETGAPTRASAANKRNTMAVKPELQDDGPRDLLTGETMFAQHYDDPPPPVPIRGLAPPKSKKTIVRWCHNVFPQHENADQH